MKKSENLTVDTKAHLVTCPKCKPKLLIPAKSCSECEYHKGIYETWPGKIDGKDNMLGEEKEVRWNEMRLDKVRVDKNAVYNIICGLPTRLPVAMMADFV